MARRSQDWRWLSSAEQDRITSELRRLWRANAFRTVAEATRHFGVSKEAVMRIIDPGYAEHRRKERQGQRTVLINKSEKASPSDCAARRAEIPPDTRSLTAVLCGDPLPLRSALAQRNLAS